MAYLYKKRVVKVRNMKYLRGRMRVLSLPSCPDWRKVRVKNSASDEMEEEPPGEWELQQMAIDKLAFQRQQSLAQRHAECLNLKQKLAEESLAELTTTTTAFLIPRQEFENGYAPSPVFRRSLRNPSLSLENLFVPPEQSSHGRKGLEKTNMFYSEDNVVQAQRMRRLQELRNQLDEIKAVGSVDAGEKELGILMKDPFFSSLKHSGSGSTLSMVSPDGIEQSKNIPEITQRLQKRREQELERARREVLLLKFNLQKVSREDEYSC